MKRISHSLFTVLFISSNLNAQGNNVDTFQTNCANYAYALIENGFLIYADSLKLNSLKDQLVKSFYIYNDENLRITHIDAEELAEFSFDFFLPSLNKILEKRNILLTVQKLNDLDNSFEILINGEIIQLYSQDDLDNYLFWDKASRNFFRHLNLILKSNNSNEQFYLLYEGNDMHSILLTENQFLIITDYFKNNEREKPYMP